MRFCYIGFAAAFLAAAPALAQDNAATNASNGTQANEVAANVMPAEPSGPATAVPPPETTPPASDEAPAVVRKEKSFPWGVLGLVGLIGLFGRWRSTS